MTILQAVQNGVLTLTFDRPTRKNALTADMYRQLAAALQAAADDDAVRVIVFAGSEAVFTAGNDLEDFLADPPSGMDSPVVHFLHQLAHAEKPLIAAVCGPAIGIGTTMLLHCDLVYAADDARFSLPFVQLGLCPEAASSLLLPKLCGYQRAAEKLLLGEPFPATEAFAMGLVNRLAPAGEVLPIAQQQAARLARLPQASLRITKRLMKSPTQVIVDDVMSKEIGHFAEMLHSVDAKEAFAAFFDKRTPRFA